MNDRVIPDVMNDVILPKGTCPENLVMICQWELCLEGGSRRGVLGGSLGFITGDMENRVIPDIMNDYILP